MAQDSSISIIAAISKNWVIGSEQSMPWRLPEDLRRFKSITVGHTVIMGRKTYESIGAALPNRINIVVSRNPNFSPKDICLVSHSLEDAIKQAKQKKSDQHEIFVIGGGEIYAQTIRKASKLYLTRICKSIQGDTYFPKISSEDWLETSRKNGSQHEELYYEFVNYKRIEANKVLNK